MKIDRLVSIIMILLEKERIRAQELAKMFEVSTRTNKVKRLAFHRENPPSCRKGISYKSSLKYAFAVCKVEKTNGKIHHKRF